MNIKRHQYAIIINYLIKHFRVLYQRQEPKLKLSLPTRINNGDCFVMATLVYVMAKAQGLNPVLHAGGWHVWVEEEGLIFDAYFPEGISHSEIKGMQINNMGEDEPPFYQGSPISGPADLSGYYFNNPDRAMYVEYLLQYGGLSLPIGLRKYLNRRSKYVNWNCARDAMKRFIIHLRKRNEKVGVYFS